jgi:hypothetical protein
MLLSTYNFDGQPFPTRALEMPMQLGIAFHSVKRAIVPSTVLVELSYKKHTSSSTTTEACSVFTKQSILQTPLEV